MYFSKFELLTEYPPGSKSLVKPFKSWIQQFPISAILTEVAGFCCYLPWQGRKSRFSAGLQTLSGALVRITFRTLATECRSTLVISEGWLKDRLKETGNCWCKITAGEKSESRKMRNPSEIYASSKSCDLKEDRKGVLAARRVSEQNWDCASGFVRCGGIQ